jgi:hypothetical protein
LRLGLDPAGTLASATSMRDIAAPLQMTTDRDDTLDRLDVAPIPFKAALNMVPIIGGSLASLINDCMARFQLEATKEGSRASQAKGGGA